MKAIAIIGYHHSGKTTAATALIRELKKRGYTVSSIKDIHAEDWRADKAGSNSAKHADAGADPVFATGPVDASLIFAHKPSLAEILPHLDTDFLVIEGMKDAPVPKIVCGRNTDDLDELIDETTIGISGLISDELDTYHGLEVYCLANRLEAFVDLVIHKSFKVLPASEPECCMACGKTCYQMACDIVQGRASRADCVQDGAPELELLINGRSIPIVPFVQKILKDNILSFVNNLKGTDPDGTIEIKLKGK